MKKAGVEIYVVGVGTNLYSLDEIVKVSSFPPEKYLYRVSSLSQFWEIVQLIIKKLRPPGDFNIPTGEGTC